MKGHSKPIQSEIAGGFRPVADHSRYPDQFLILQLAQASFGRGEIVELKNGLFRTNILWVRRRRVSFRLVQAN